MQVVVWSKKPCVQCSAVYRAFNSQGMVEGIDYEVRNLPDFPDALEAFKARGLMQAPIVESDFVETFSGFNPELVKAITREKAHNG
ncbi:glutaredoxin domain-containing protein [Arthrobacter sp. 18067]|uniref:glutaredoxin domain-containing protein n=1 Tax=Arthrobacter sp. 18067 TaxID=2681413 RepID=UPI0013577875|nr:glutaredoxin domain-containing protein [Arthrobacter sp. 18067]